MVFKCGACKSIAFSSPQIVLAKKGVTLLLLNLKFWNLEKCRSKMSSFKRYHKCANTENCIFCITSVLKVCRCLCFIGCCLSTSHPLHQGNSIKVPRDPGSIYYGYSLQIRRLRKAQKIGVQSFPLEVWTIFIFCLKWVSAKNKQMMYIIKTLIICRKQSELVI